MRLISRKLHPLSVRQYEVLMAYAEGLTYRQIAAKLGVAYDTVKRHAEETRQKLDVPTLAEAYFKIRRMTRER